MSLVSSSKGPKSFDWAGNLAGQLRVGSGMVQPVNVGCPAPQMRSPSRLLAAASRANRVYDFVAWASPVYKIFLGVDSRFFSAIVLFKNQRFPQGFCGFLERRIPGKNGEVTPIILETCPDGTRNDQSRDLRTAFCSTQLLESASFGLVLSMR